MTRSACRDLALLIACVVAAVTPVRAQEVRLVALSCKGAADASPLRPGPGDYEHALEIDGAARRYELHVPRSYDGKRDVPLVLNLHGGGANAAIARRHTGFDAKADQAGCIVAYPDGTSLMARNMLLWNAGSCCGFPARAGVDDVRFLDAVVADVARHFRIDGRRVYACGHSNGGMLVHRLACERPDRYAAVASVAGPLECAECRPARPIPVMHLHGTADPVVPYLGGSGRASMVGMSFSSARSTIEGWVGRNRCSPTSTTTVRGAARIERWPAARDGAEVVFVTIEGGGHLWPGSPRRGLGLLVDSSRPQVSANDLIWEFFARQGASR